jgi:hypothetical protein
VDALTEIEYRAAYLLDYIDVPRAELEEELRGIADAAERLRRETSLRILKIEGQLGLRPALRVVPGDD